MTTEELPPSVESPPEPIASSSPLVVEDPFVNSSHSPVNSWSSHYGNVIQLPEHQIGEPHISNLIESSCNNHNINRVISTAESDKGDADVSETNEKELSESLSSNEYVSLHASLSKPNEVRLWITINF